MLWKLHSGATWMLTLDKWHAYLLPHSTTVASPLREEIDAVLGPGT